MENAPNEPRTEEQIIGRTPVILSLGGKNYNIYPLPISKSREWRAECSKIFDVYAEKLDTRAETNEELTKSVRSLLNEIPAMVYDLVFMYAPNLPRAIIEEEATDQELFDALIAIFLLAYPFVKIRNLMSGSIPGRR